MDVGRGEPSRQVNLDSGQQMTARVIADEHVHERVIEADEPGILRGCETGQRALMLRKDACPALLPGRQRTVMQNDDFTAARLPAPRSELSPHCAKVVPMLAQLMAGDDAVLKID
jgi:hypothetical protein